MMYLRPWTGRCDYCGNQLKLGRTGTKGTRTLRHERTSACTHCGAFFRVNLLIVDGDGPDSAIVRVQGPNVTWVRKIGELHDFLLDLWYCPSKYSPYSDGSRSAWTHLLRHIVIIYPNSYAISLKHYMDNA